MSLCGNSECFGLEPCDQCRDVRIEVTRLAVRSAGMTKEQCEKFYQAYAEAFDGALMAIRSAREALVKQRLDEKEAKEKEAEKAAEEARMRKKHKNGSHEKAKAGADTPASEVTTISTKES